MLLAGSQSLADDPATTAEICLAMQAATVRIVSGADLSSGVILTAEGHILTVAHGLHNDSDSVTIVFSDGEAVAANILLRDTKADLAVLKVAPADDPRKFFPVPICAGSLPQKGEMAFAAGYPGRERTGLSPVIRIGELLAIEPQVFRSSCALTAGDSGGPLCNHRGELIGLHRQIGLGNESNLHIRSDRIRDVVASIPELRKLTSAERVEADASLSLPAPSPDVLSVCRLRTVEICTTPDDQTPAVLGTQLDSLHVATKLSELAPNATIVCRFSTGVTSIATVAHRDVALDLAILRQSQAQTAATSLQSDVNSRKTESGGVAGLIVFASLGPDSVGRAGLVTRGAHTEPPTNGKLGAILEATDLSVGVRVTDVAPNSTAAKAGFAKNDLIIAINAQLIMSLDDTAGALKQLQPGDWLQFELQRDAKHMSAFAQLQHDPGEKLELGEFLNGRAGKVSERRTGFTSLLQHDIPLAPTECGGPLCDSSGRIIGINIARRARESTLAVPIDMVLQAMRNTSQSPDE
jgi:serine protease Do